MNDQDVVKFVIEENYLAWYGHLGAEVLDYSPIQTPFQEQAATVSFNVLVFQNWKRHLDNALEVVKNWKSPV